MKRIVSVLFAVILTILSLRAQTADNTIGGLISNKDWFGLAREYPKLKDSVRWEPLKHLSEAMIGFYFNKPDSVINNVDWIVSNAQKDLGFDNVKSMIVIKSMTLNDMGKYAEAADYLDNFLNHVNGKVPVGDLRDFYTTYRMYNKVRYEARPEVIRHGRGDITVPIKIEKLNIKDRKDLNEYLIYIPVKINDKEYKFIFDTGASYSYVSERFAKEVGLRVVDSTYVFGGMRTSVGGRGTTDSITVGGVTFKNPLFIVGKDNEEMDTIFKMDAVLGQDFIMRIGETRIYPNEGKIVFPAGRTSLPPYGQNLIMDNKQLYIDASSNDEKMLFHFDTGATKSELLGNYYDKHKEDIDRNGHKTTSGRGGEGGITHVDVYKIKKFPVSVGGCGIELKDVDVVLNKYHSMQNMEDGSLGMDFIMACKEVIINTDGMFIKVVK